MQKTVLIVWNHDDLPKGVIIATKVKYSFLISLKILQLLSSSSSILSFSIVL